MKRLSKEKGHFVLKSLGYRQYERYLKTVKKDDYKWGNLHDVSGKISEIKDYENYSIFSLEGKDKDVFGQKLLLTDIDLDKINGHELVKTSDWRIKKAVAQRIFYLSLCNSRERINFLSKLKKKVKKNHYKKIFFKPLENGLAYDYKDFGYYAKYSPSYSSRTQLIKEGIYVKLGKYYRSPLCLAPMPDSSGSLDAIVTAALCHMLAVIPRNFEFKSIERQKEFARSILSQIDKIKPLSVKKIARRNVCVAIGIGDEDKERFAKLYEIGVRSFRLYSIATDKRIIDFAKKLIDEIIKLSTRKDPIELFIGQITSIKQFNELFRILGARRWKFVDGFFLGNGGGSRCKTAETGMIVNTASISYLLKNNRRLEDKSIVIEGGVGNEPAIALLLGASGLSYSAGITGGCIEAPGGAIYITDTKGYWKPYRGEASPSAKIVENRIYPTGDAIQVEGANGFIRMEKKYPSMCGRILNLNEWLAQSFVKLGVKNIEELHNFTKLPLALRSEAQRNVAKAYGVGDKIQSSEILDIDYTMRIS